MRLPNILLGAGRAAALALAMSGATALAGPGTPMPSLAKRFDAEVRADDQIGWIQSMAAEPNRVGDPHNLENANRTLALFKSWGWDARLETFNILYPSPLDVSLEMLSPQAMRFGAAEPAPGPDHVINKPGSSLLPYVAFQGDGVAVGDLVYVNYGMAADYEWLDRLGIDVRGKIVIARYGMGWRGLKPKLAQERGAIGCILYSDPADDGYAVAESYPAGGARPPTGLQRGSVLDLPIRPGDPLTPDIGATSTATRLDRAQAETILKIPVLPIGYADARPILEALQGPVATGANRGALPITYHVGGNGAVRVRLGIQSAWQLQKIYNVIATLKGAAYPDSWIIRGNHRDAWGLGAADPLSGHAAMLSEAKALGTLVRDGWRPKRTIIYASWDGEEPGLFGSTEWVESHIGQLRENGMLYINTDANAAGFLKATGSPEWQHLLNGVISQVTDPATGRSVGERLRAGIKTRTATSGREDQAAYSAALAGDDMLIGPLGAGSDYTAFVHHAGIPALNIGFGGEDQSSGTYHSAYDNFDHFDRFVDPGARYGVALSRVVGRVVIEASEAEASPVRFRDLASAVARYTQELESLATRQRTDDLIRQAMIADGSFTIASDSRQPTSSPPSLQITPVLDFGGLNRAVEGLLQQANAIDASAAKAWKAPTAMQRKAIAQLWRLATQSLWSDAGLPVRPWYKNLLSAPGRLTGYEAKSLPGVREAIEFRQFAEANTQIVILSDAIDRLALKFASMVADLRREGG